MSGPNQRVVLKHFKEQCYLFPVFGTMKFHDVLQLIVLLHCPFAPNGRFTISTRAQKVVHIGDVTIFIVLLSIVVTAGNGLKT